MTTKALRHAVNTAETITKTVPFGNAAFIDMEVTKEHGLALCDIIAGKTPQECGLMSFGWVVDGALTLR